MLNIEDNDINDARQLEKLGNIQAALESIEKAIEIKSKDLPCEISFSLLYEKSLLLEQLGAYENALVSTSETLNTASNCNEKISALILRGICQAETDQLDLAEESLELAIDLAKNNQELVHLSKALQTIARNVYFLQGRFTIALSSMEEARTIPKLSGSADWNLPFMQALISVTTGDRKNARKSLDELLRFVTPASRIAGEYYYLWSVLALDEGELEKAEEYIYLALRIANQSSAPDLAIWIRIEKSRLFRLRQEFLTARTWAEDAVRFALRQNTRFFKGLAYLELAMVGWAIEDSQTTSISFQNSIDDFSYINARYELSRARFFQAVWLQQINKPISNKNWQDLLEYIVNNGYTFLLQKESRLAFPIIAAHIKSKYNSVSISNQRVITDLLKVPPDPLKILGLGQFRVWQGYQQIPEKNWTRRKAGELFRFLLLQPNMTGMRDQILDSFWPEINLSNALTNFHQSTSTLRRILEPDLPDKFVSRYLEIEGERISLKLPQGSSFDAMAFEIKMFDSVKKKKIDLLKNAINQYPGILFPMDIFLDWSSIWRARLEERFIQGLITLAQLYLENDDNFEALNCIDIVLQKDEWNEDAVLIKMTILNSLGNAPKVLITYNDFSRKLKQEFGLEPRVDLRKLVNSIQKR